MANNRLEHIKLNCHECTHDGQLEYNYLTEKLISDENLSLKNIAELIERFVCSKCNAKNFQVFDIHQLMLFDTEKNIICEICELPLPYPRLSAMPSTRRCTKCENSKEKVNNDIKFPDVPVNLRGKCPSCQKKREKGIVVVYQNSNDKSFFLGCSSFPKCMWSTSKYWEELNES